MNSRRRQQTATTHLGFVLSSQQHKALLCGWPHHPWPKKRSCAHWPNPQCPTVPPGSCRRRTEDHEARAQRVEPTSENDGGCHPWHTPATSSPSSHIQKQFVNVGQPLIGHALLPESVRCHDPSCLPFQSASHVSKESSRAICSLAKESNQSRMAHVTPNSTKGLNSWTTKWICSFSATVVVHQHSLSNVHPSHEVGDHGQQRGILTSQIARQASPTMPNRPREHPTGRSTPSATSWYHARPSSSIQCCAREIVCVVPELRNTCWGSQVPDLTSCDLNTSTGKKGMSSNVKCPWLDPSPPQTPVHGVVHGLPTKQRQRAFLDPSSVPSRIQDQSLERTSSNEAPAPQS